MTCHSLTRPEGAREYLFYPAASAIGTVVFLAGTGSTAEWAVDETGLSEVAKAGFHLVVPEATRVKPDEPPRFISNPPRWNDGSPAPTPELESNVDDVAFLNALIDELQERKLAERIFLIGFSNGAGMAFRYAAEHAERLTALAPIAGLWWPTGATPSKPLPTYYLLGLADLLIPYRGGEVHLPWGNRLVRRPSAIATLEAWAAAIGCEPRSRIVKEAGGIRQELFTSPDVEFRATLIEGLGHHWPGGRGQLNARIAGPWKESINLTQELMAFFNRCS